MNKEELQKLKKDELIELILQLQAEMNKIKAKMSGKIGAAAGFGTQNPNVR